ncbi:MAG: hypothetical protein Q3976_02265 [Corynebacterium sp.]|nr:hypothetical protein [Corynebacterium sp.]
MKTSTKVWDRIACCIFGLLLLTGGLWAALFYFDIPWLQDNANLADLVDLNVLHDIDPENSGYQLTLAAVAIIGIAWGLHFLWANLRPNRVRRVPIIEGNGTVGLNDVADMVASDLAEVDGVISTRVKVFADSGERIARINITTAAYALSTLDHAVQQAERDFRAALPEVDFSTEYVLQVSQP